MTRAISSSLSIATTSHRPVAGDVLDCHTGNCPLSGLGAGDAPSLGSRLCNDDQLSAQLTAVDTAFIPHCEGRTGGQRLARSESTVESNVVRPNGHPLGGLTPILNDTLTNHCPPAQVRYQQLSRIQWIGRVRAGSAPRTSPVTRVTTSRSSHPAQ